jgi:hypothetical protein
MGEKENGAFSQKLLQQEQAFASVLNTSKNSF